MHRLRIHRQHLLVRSLQGLLIGFVDYNKNIKYHKSPILWLIFLVLFKSWIKSIEPSPYMTKKHLPCYVAMSLKLNVGKPNFCEALLDREETWPVNVHVPSPCMINLSFGPRKVVKCCIRLCCFLFSSQLWNWAKETLRGEKLFSYFFLMGKIMFKFKV